MASYKWPPQGGSVTAGDLTDAGTDGIVITNGTGAVLGTGTSLAQHVADTTHNGYLSSTDWNTFNSKEPAVTKGNLTDAGTDGIVITGGTGAVIGSGTSLAQHVADSTHNGYLSSADWTTFNNKQAAGSYITALTGDVTASGPGSAAATLATVNSNVGSFTNAAVTVNAKGLVTAASSGTTGNLTDAGTDGIVVTGGTGAVLGTGTSLAQHVADATHNGYLSSTDWSTFNSKQSSLSFTSPLVNTAGTVALQGASGVAFVGSGGTGATTLAYTNANTNSALVQRDGSGNFSAGTITASLSGNATSATTATTATTATNATNTAITDDTTTSATMYPTWVTTASGNQAQKVSSTKLTFNPSTAALTTTTFVGALTGTASGNTTYSANNHGVVLSSATNAMTVLAPDASTVKWLKSGGSSADPAWTAFSTPTVQRFTSSTGNYTTPSPAPLWLKVTAIGGGGGGAGSSNNTFDGGDGGTGGNTTWASTVIVANGGVGATHSSGGGAAAPAGGSVSTTSPAVVIWAAQGGTGSGSGNTSTATEVNGGSGGNSLYGGAGQSRGAGAGTAAIANTGSGGGGGGTPTSANNCYGGGGGAGGAVVAIIPNPSGTYAYAIGAAGTAGTAGTSGSAGGAGGAGIIIVEEFYQ